MSSVHLSSCRGVYLEAIEDGTAETERLLLVDHGHKEEDDGRPGWLGGGRDGHEESLVIVVPPDHLGETV